MDLGDRKNTDVATANMQLITAVAIGDLETAKSAVASGADIYWTCCEKRIKVRPRYQNMPNALLENASVFEVALVGDFEDIISWLVDIGYDLNRTFIECYTPLQTAVSYSPINTIRLLISLGADVNKQNGMGTTAIGCACRFQRSDVLEYLLSIGANVDVTNQSGSTALHGACKSQFPRGIELLLGYGADPDTKNSNGYKPIDLLPQSASICRSIFTAGSATKACYSRKTAPK